MTDREKIEAALTVIHSRSHWGLMPVAVKPDEQLVALVEHLLRGTAERAWAAAWAQIELDMADCRFPPDFPLVLDAPKEAPK